MANQHVYSSKEFLALTLIFIFAGVVAAASILLSIPPKEEPSLIVFTDKNKYYTGELMEIYLANILGTDIRIDSLSFQKWVDGKWEPLIDINIFTDLFTDYLEYERNFTRLEPLGSGRNTAILIYELGELFTEGKYRVYPFAYIPIYHQWVRVPTGFYSEFNVSARTPTPPRFRLEVATDKTVYHEGENITVTVKNILNQTVFVSGIRLSKWAEGKLTESLYTPTSMVLANLEPEQIAQGFFPSTFSTPGSYWVICEGWIEQDEQIVYVWGYTSILVEEKQT
jgi:hypothetical protein